MYRRASQRFQFTNTDLLLQRRVLAAACAVLLATAVAFGTLYANSSGYQRRVQDQVRSRMDSACAAALDEVNRLGSIVTTNTSARISRARQYLYYMEQLNSLTVALDGTGSSLVPSDTFPTLYADLETLEELILQSTTSILDARTTMIDHLTTLRAYLNAR